MEETTLDGPVRRHRPSSGERLGAWFYTGPAGRLVSFSIDLGLSLAALGLYGAHRAWQRLRRRQSSAA
jgi:hypothetical protein